MEEAMAWVIAVLTTTGECGWLAIPWLNPLIDHWLDSPFQLFVCHVTLSGYYGGGYGGMGYRRPYYNSGYYGGGYGGSFMELGF